jgi:uncharacterized membrane protein YadS
MLPASQQFWKEGCDHHSQDVSEWPLHRFDSLGAGYAVSESAGNTAVIVKRFRVFLLLPVVLGVDWYFTRMGATRGRARVPVPVFGLMFLALCFRTRRCCLLAAWCPVYPQVKNALVEASTWGLLLAVSALGLGTSLAAIAALGWRHIATLMVTTAIIVVIVTGGLLVLD